VYQVGFSFFNQFSNGCFKPLVIPVRPIADTGTPTIIGSQTGITVNPAASATTLVVSGYPTSTIAGVAQTFTVTAKDASNNTVTTYTGTVTFSSSDKQAVLPANSALTNGVGTFSATLETAGIQSITARLSGQVRQ
jgi:hypothetical protein